MIGKRLEALIQLGKKVTERNFTFINRTLESVIENSALFMVVSEELVKPHAISEIKKSPETSSMFGFWFGIGSIFFNSFIFIPACGMILGLIGLYNYNKYENNNAWYGWIGVILNFIYIFVGLYANGFISSP